MEIWILWFIPRRGDTTSEPLLIGLYSSGDEVQRAVGRLSELPGFREEPHLTDDAEAPGFFAETYTVNTDQWTSGFIDGASVDLSMEGEGDATIGDDVL